jgi:hypothetical protein
LQLAAVFCICFLFRYLVAFLVHHFAEQTLIFRLITNVTNSQISLSGMGKKKTASHAADCRDLATPKPAKSLNG